MTKKEKEVLQFIIEFKKTNGFAPTTREIADGTFTTNVSYIREILSRLQERGYITMKPHSGRTIVVKKFI